MSAFTATQLQVIEATENLSFPRYTWRKKKFTLGVLRIEQAIKLTGAKDLLAPVIEILREADEFIEEDVNDLIQHRLAAGGKARE